MDSLYFDGRFRFASKKAAKTLITTDPARVSLEVTAFGSEAVVPLPEVKPGRYYIVGPEPYTRKWYATIIVSPDGAIKFS